MPFYFGNIFLVFFFFFLQEYNPDLAHSISKKEKSGKGDKIKLTHVTPSVHNTQAGDRGR